MSVRKMFFAQREKVVNNTNKERTRRWGGVSLFMMFLLGVVIIPFAWAEENQQQSKLSPEILNDQVSKGYGALGLKITNHTGNSYTVKVCDRSNHTCETVNFIVAAQNYSSKSAQLVAKIRYEHQGGGYGPWTTYGSSMVPGVQNDNYVFALSGPSVTVGPQGVGGTGNTSAQIMYTLTRNSESKSILFQINKVLRGTYADTTYTGSYQHRSVFPKNFEDHVGPGTLLYCGYRKGASEPPSNCTVNWADWISPNNSSDPRRKISMRTKGSNKTGTITWTITTHECINP